MFICLCKGITDEDVRRLGESGITEPTELIAILGLDDRTCCGKCARNAGHLAELACEAHASSCRASAGGQGVLTSARAAIL
jgi:bacterioferritin-associated ferredoxin